MRAMTDVACYHIRNVGIMQLFQHSPNHTEYLKHLTKHLDRLSKLLHHFISEKEYRGVCQWTTRYIKKRRSVVPPE